MNTISAFEAKAHFSALLQRVEEGEQIVITKHGHPVAKLISIISADRTVKRKAIHKLKMFLKSDALGLDWKKLRDESRR